MAAIRPRSRSSRSSRSSSRIRGRDYPRTLGVAIALYSYWALAGMAVFGRDAWTKGGEGFAVAFSLLSRIAPFAVRDGAIVVRWPFVGLAGAERVPGTLVFVAVLLGSTSFDGFAADDHLAEPDRGRPRQRRRRVAVGGRSRDDVRERRGLWRSSSVSWSSRISSRFRARACSSTRPAHSCPNSCSRSFRSRSRTSSPTTSRCSSSRGSSSSRSSPIRSGAAGISSGPSTSRRISRSSHPRPSGTSRSGRSSWATWRGSPSPMTARSRCSRAGGTLYAPSTRCSG